jgi:hypothetical protein
MPPNEKFKSVDVDISFIAALYHPLSIAVENRAVSITGMKLWYCLHRSRSSAYTVCTLLRLCTHCEEEFNLLPTLLQVLLEN